MTRPTDSLTPLLLRSEIRSRINANTTKVDVDNRLLGIVIDVSQIFQGACLRRFDEFVETRYFTPFPLAEGGDLLDLRKLRLDMDLKPAISVNGVPVAQTTTIINGDASAITANNVTYMPLNEPYKRVIRLNPYGIQFWYHAGTTDPIGSISVTATWGFGGQWIPTGATLTSTLDGVQGTFNPSAGLEDGMVLLIDSEYMYVSAYLATIPFTVTVQRGFNGSTAVPHATSNAPIYRWQSNRAVQQCMVRLIQVALEQDKSPLFGQMTVGDVTIPVDVADWPKDVQSIVRLNSLQRVPRIQGV